MPILPFLIIVAAFAISLILLLLRIDKQDVPQYKRVSDESLRKKYSDFSVPNKPNVQLAGWASGRDYTSDEVPPFIRDILERRLAEMYGTVNLENDEDTLELSASELDALEDVELGQQWHEYIDGLDID